MLRKLNFSLSELGVRLEDKEKHTVIKLVGKEELKKEMEQLKQAEERKRAEKEKKKAIDDAKKAEREQQMKVNPMEMFKDPKKYSKYDEKVIVLSYFKYKFILNFRIPDFCKTILYFSGHSYPRCKGGRIIKIANQKITKGLC